MNHSRAALQQALNAVFAAKTEDDRAKAAAFVIEALNTHVSEGDAAEGAPVTDHVAANVRELIGDQPIPAGLMTNAELESFNLLLPWAAMTSDPQGRVLGTAWSATKRSVVHGLIESRLMNFNKAYPLKGKHVAELGCFEGIHTLALMLLGASVTAIDGRVENVLKTMARLWAYGRSADTQLWDFEREATPNIPAEWDALHHIGVLYHLSNPVEHLDVVLRRTREAVLLDTHVADDEAQASNSYTALGKVYRYKHKKEPMAAVAPFAGLRDHAKQLLLEDLVEVIRERGFADVRVASDRMERNGRRVTIWAFR